MLNKMRELVLTTYFIKAFKKLVKHNPILKQKLDYVLEQMRQDVFANYLNTHKLTGELSGLLACSCGYDCRIIFSIHKNDNNQEVIVLHNIGTHKDVY